MGAHVDSLDAIVAAVTAAAIDTPTGPLHATRDPSEIIQGRPTLLVMPDVLVYSAMCGDGALEVAALLVGVASDPGLTQLLDVVDQVANLVGANEARRVTWTPPGADPLPAFQLS